MALSSQPVSVGPIDTTASPDARRVYVANDVMSPVYEIGDEVVSDPLRPPAPGCDVLLIRDADGNEFETALRRLEGISPTHWTARQTNPPKTERLDRKIWHTAERIVFVIRR